jgi:uncharacterized membrane protein YbhN (UPF0104 family)
VVAGPEAVTGVLGAIGWIGAAQLLLIYTCTQAVRTLRIWVAINVANRPAFRRLFAVVALHQFLNHVLPARLGEAGFPLLLKRYSDVPTASAVSVLLMVRLQEMLVLALMVLVATPLFFTFRQSAAVPWVPIVITCAFAAIAVIVISAGAPHASRLCRRMLDRQLTAGTSGRARWLERFHGFSLQLERELATPGPRGRRVVSFILTAFVWLLTFLLFHQVLQMSGFPVPFTGTVIAASMASLTHILPVNTFGSFGSLEAGWTLGLSLVGIDVKGALATGFVAHVLVLLFLIVLSVPSWLILERGIPSRDKR